MADALTFGVEEEFFVVDAETRALRPRAEQLLSTAHELLGDHVELELNLSMIETTTPVTRDLEELRGHLIQLRCGLMAAAERHGSRIAATGTHPFSEWLGQQITPKERYAEMDKTYQVLAWEQLVCGCHVHVGIPQEDLAVRVMDRCRPWLAVLRALTANSPFSEGVDTGYASYRTEIFDRWPTTGLPPVLRHRQAYEELVGALVATGTIADASKLYWDVRPSSRYATLEFRVADVCATVDEAVLLAALVRSLVRTACAEEARGERLADVAEPILRAARWQSARYGLEGTLVDPVEWTGRPARAVVEVLLGHLRADLEEHAEWKVVREGVDKVLERGTGAARQRRALVDGSFTKVVDAIVATTAPSTLW